MIYKINLYLKKKGKKLPNEHAVKAFLALKLLCTA